MDLGVPLIILGITLIVIGIIVSVLSKAQNVEWGGGAVIFIGPVPIVIGGGKLGWLAILIAVLLAFAMILMTFVYLRSMPLEPPRQTP
ncbi:hypothetical protein EYM_05695 [Ignicoccus islandicus DSM 13165]|uniref:DUF131 domain-containing protein n=1 Tax=Ignicoccus islandicus DSM 13165 TaxID=940295 RepID=A0A0U3F2X3_9CREN|nr:DUF131 domain-containing protein [Ignicoccus islandicus]ALU11877.1 hypothetical protein EYM_05695 [Ignicoccus islandicus DSM 13165]